MPIHAKVTIDKWQHDDRPVEMLGRTRGGDQFAHLAGARVAYKALTGPLEPVNEGSFRALEVIIPEGNIMMARFPAPMSGWSAIVPTVVDTIVAALGDAMPDRVPPAIMGCSAARSCSSACTRRPSRRFVVQSIEGGGWGGRPSEDGESATVSVCQGDVRNGSIEGIELKCPVLVESARTAPGLGRRRQVPRRARHRHAGAQPGRRPLEFRAPAAAMPALGPVGRQARRDRRLSAAAAGRERVQVDGRQPRSRCRWSPR